MHIQETNFSRPHGWRGFCYPRPLPHNRKNRDSRGRGKLGRSAAKPFSLLLV